MKFPFLASVVILIIVIQHNIRRGSKLLHKEEQSFWDKENASNSIRKQSLDHLEYISFRPEALYPLALLGKEKCADFMEANPQTKEILPRFVYLSEQKLVNLSEQTNTELKMKYGVANLPLLSQYDANYEEAITLLQKYALLYVEQEYHTQAITILEYAVSLGSDIKKTYELLADLYRKMGQTDQIYQLKQEAENISTSRKEAILTMLEEAAT